MISTVLAGLLAALTPLQDTLPIPPSYAAALEAGTRSRSGAPGPRYWQQDVSYRIRASLAPAEALVRAEETIRYTNRAPRALRSVVLNLNQNVFAAGNPRNRQAPITGGFTLDRVVVQGRGYDIRGRGGKPVPTVIEIELAEPLPTGGSVDVEVAWHFTVPEDAFRMGRDGLEVFFLAQWYPQIAVYDDLRGWARDPYFGDGEFFLSYGDFDVELTVPEGWLVGASGVLQNPEEVLTETAIQRLGRASTGGDIVNVVTEGDLTAGRATRTGTPSGTLTWRFVAENVRDFAWGASDRYVWDATRAEYDDGQGGTQTSAIHTLYRPDRANWERSAEFARFAIESHSHWFPYPYPHMTVNEGVIGGGMEYPMITIVGGTRTPISLEGVISHEIAHMWWPMVIGTDEKAHAWMDEGLASFSEDLYTPLLFPGVNTGLNTMNTYLSVAGSDAETESMRHADLYGPFGNRGVASYQKPASALRALRAYLGEGLFDRALREYTRRWAFRHPQPLDLFWTFEDVTGRDLDWFFYPWMYTTRVTDQAVVSARTVESGGAYRVAVLVEDRGEIPMPVVIQVRTRSGRTFRTTASVERWDGDRMELVVDTDGPAAEVIVDPDQVLPDVNRGDNRVEPGG